MHHLCCCACLCGAGVEPTASRVLGGHFIRATPQPSCPFHSKRETKSQLSGTCVHLSVALLLTADGEHFHTPGDQYDFSQPFDGGGFMCFPDAGLGSEDVAVRSSLKSCPLDIESVTLYTGEAQMHLVQGRAGNWNILKPIWEGNCWSFTPKNHLIPRMATDPQKH